MARDARDGGRGTSGRTRPAGVTVRILAAVGLAALWMAWGIGPTVSQAQRERPEGWDDATHHRRVAPDYDRLFAMDRVHELHISIAPDDFRAMQEDLRTITPGMPGPGGGRLGGGGLGRGGGGFDIAAAVEEAAAACTDRPADSPCSLNGTDGQCNAMMLIQPSPCHLPPR
jgi:hypothetical protein